MYIKMKNPRGTTVIYNRDIGSYVGFFARENMIMFDTGVKEPMMDENGIQMEDEYGEDVVEAVYDTLTFSSDEEAEDARDRIFERLGMKNPMSNVLDLTVKEQVLVENDAETGDNEPDSDDNEVLVEEKTE